MRLAIGVVDGAAHGAVAGANDTRRRQVGITLLDVGQRLVLHVEDARILVAISELEHIVGAVGRADTKVLVSLAVEPRERALDAVQLAHYLDGGGVAESGHVAVEELDVFAVHNYLRLRNIPGEVGVTNTSEQPFRSGSPSARLSPE